ncbi:MAG: pyridoxal phosphate-dependent aminotransferase [Spirochaetales bacterium]
MNFAKRVDFFAPRNALDLERSERGSMGLPLFDLSQSNPTKTGFAFPQAELAAALSDAANVDYSPDPRGLPRARAEIAASLLAEGRGKIDESRLILCASTSEAYSYLFKLLCDPGDLILVPKPGYPLFDHLSALEAVRGIGYRLEYDHPAGWSVDLSSIEAILSGPEGSRVKAIVLINPNNPTGSYLRAKELRSILDLCRRFSLAIISDEVFHGFELESPGDKVSLLGREEVLTFVLDGLSKSLCLPQMKLGWIYISGPPEEAAKASSALELISDTFLSAGAPVMNAVGKLLARGESIRESVKERTRQVLSIYREILQQEGSPHRVLTCGGGWTALVQSPGFAGEEELARGLLREEGLYVHPGFFFDMEREAFFAFSLIVRPEDAYAAAIKYRNYFDRFLKDKS